jgi:hypothetical protein
MSYIKNPNPNTPKQALGKINISIRPCANSWIRIPDNKKIEDREINNIA